VTEINYYAHRVEHVCCSPISRFLPQVVFVGHGGKKKGVQYVETLKMEGRVPLYIDPKRKTHTALGLIDISTPSSTPSLSYSPKTHPLHPCRLVEAVDRFEGFPALQGGVEAGLQGGPLGHRQPHVSVLLYRLQASPCQRRQTTDGLFFDDAHRQLGGVALVSQDGISFFHQCHTTWDYPEVDDMLALCASLQ
jgi:hypothetical protein